MAKAVLFFFIVYPFFHIYHVTQISKRETNRTGGIKNGKQIFIQGKENQGRTMG